MKFCDSHTDFLTAIADRKDREEYVASIKQCGGRVISCALFTTSNGLGLKEAQLKKEEVDFLMSKYDIKLLFSIEDLGFVKSLDEVSEVCLLNPISATLTWNYDNQFGGGSHSNQGLTSLGRKCASLLEERNVLVDTAHMSRKMFWDFCKMTTKPIYNSHSNVYSLRHHKRNLTDAQLEKIAITNGFMGLTFYDEFIWKGEVSCAELAKHFDYLIKHFGCDNFGLGSDLYGVDPQHLPEGLNGYQHLVNLQKEFEKLGYSQKVIEKIFYKNYENFLKRVFI